MARKQISNMKEKWNDMREAVLMKRGSSAGVRTKRSMCVF